MSRDSGQKGQIIIDLKDPWNPKIISFQKNFQGHTSTCLNDCRFMWSVGGTQGAPTPAKASSVSVTDIRDPMHPFVVPDAVRRRRPAHRLDRRLDALRRRRLRRRRLGLRPGGVRGYWTEGLHKDPTTGQDALRDAVRPDRLRRRPDRRRQRQLVHAQRVPRADGARRPGRRAT